MIKVISMDYQEMVLFTDQFHLYLTAVIVADVMQHPGQSHHHVTYSTFDFFLNLKILRFKMLRHSTYVSNILYIHFLFISHT